MTLDESIEVLTCHELHWEHLLEQGICDAHEGKETISSLTMAIASLEAWEKVKAEIEDYMNRKWEQLSDSDKVMVTGVTTIDDWKYHMAESTLDIINRHLQEVEE